LPGGTQRLKDREEEERCSRPFQRTETAADNRLYFYTHTR